MTTSKFIIIFFLLFKFKNFYRYTDSSENPFTETGILSKKADFILNRSIITRTSLQIVDPDKLEDDSSSNLFESFHSPDSLKKDSEHTDLLLNNQTGDTEITGVVDENKLPKKIIVDTKNIKRKERCCVLQ